MKHSPGPWSIDPEGLHETRIQDANGEVIASVYNNYHSERNESLIAAAPELLAALDAAQNQLVLLACEDWTRTLSADRLESLGVTIKVARAAIAKARGTKWN